jgi:hypothetical protein
MAGLFLFSVYLLIYRGGFHSVDEVSIFAVTESLVKFGRLNTDQIAWTQWTTSQAEAQGFFGTDGHVYSKKGLAQSLAQAPLYGLALISPGLGMLQTVSLLNGMVTAFTAILLSLFLSRMGFSPGVTLLTTLIYGITTIAAVYARYLFSEPLAGFFLLLAAYMLFAYRQEGGTRHVVIAGLAAGAAVLTRANNLFLLPFFGLYLLWIVSGNTAGNPLQRADTGQQQPLNSLNRLIRPEAVFTIAAFIIAAALPGLIIMGYNAVRVGDPLQTGYDLTLFSPNLLLGLYKLLLSPLRGFFVYSPVLLLSIPGWFLLRRRFPAESLLFLTVAGVTILLFSAWSSGEGLSWGSRFLVPVVPFFAICLGPVVEIGVRPPSSRSHYFFKAALIILIPLSFAVQLSGVIVNPWVYLAELQTQFGGEFFLENTDALYDFRTSQIVGQIKTFGVENSDLIWWQPWGFDLFAFSVSLALVVITGSATVFLLRQTSRLKWSQMVAVLLVSGGLIIVSSYLLLSRYMLTDQQFGLPGDSYTETLAEIAINTPDASIITVAPYHYHVPMNRFKEQVRLTGFAQQAWPPPDTATDLLNTTTKNDHIWLVTLGFPPAAVDNAAEKWLASNTYKISDEWQPDNVRRVHFTSGQSGQKQTLNINFNREIKLTAVEYPGQVATGQPVPVTFQLETDAVPEADYNLFLQLLAPDGTLVAQHDSPPVGGYAPTTSWVSGQKIISRHGLVPAYDPLPGEYQLIAGFVNPNSGERLPTSSGTDFVVLGNLSIIAN